MPAVGGYLPIAEHGLIGDMRTVALVGTDGADYSVDPISTTITTYRGYEMLVHGFGPGFSGPLQLVAPLSSPADRAGFDSVVSAVSHTSGVATAGPEFFPVGPGHPAVAVAEAYQPAARGTSPPSTSSAI